MLACFGGFLASKGERREACELVERGGVGEHRPYFTKLKQTASIGFSLLKISM